MGLSGINRNIFIWGVVLTADSDLGQLEADHRGRIDSDRHGGLPVGLRVTADSHSRASPARLTWCAPRAKQDAWSEISDPRPGAVSEAYAAEFGLLHLFLAICKKI